MDIHNLMEDLVKTTVHELFDLEEKGATGSFCTCRQCRMDVACYVLNRLKPEYVVSARGVAYVEQDYTEKLQRVADVVSLVREGWARINATKRPNHAHSSDEERAVLPAGPVFNVPPIMGRIFKSTNFEPLSDIQVHIEDDAGLVRMMDANWQNPIQVVKNTAGTFIFWPYPVPSDAVGETRRFCYTIKSEIPGFEDVSHYLELDVTSEPVAMATFSMQNVHRLHDMYVFPK